MRNKNTTRKKRRRLLRTSFVFLFSFFELFFKLMLTSRMHMCERTFRFCANFISIVAALVVSHLAQVEI